MGHGAPKWTLRAREKQRPIKRMISSRETKNHPGRESGHLIHADPGVTFRTVGHDAVVAGKSDDEASCEAVAVDGTDGRY